MILQHKAVPGRGQPEQMRWPAVQCAMAAPLLQKEIPEQDMQKKINYRYFGLVNIQTVNSCYIKSGHIDRNYMHCAAMLKNINSDIMT